MSVMTVQRVTNLEKKTDEMKKQMDDFQLSVQKRRDADGQTEVLTANIIAETHWQKLILKVTDFHLWKRLKTIERHLMPS